MRSVINTSSLSVAWDSDNFFHQKVCVLIIWHLLFCVKIKYSEHYFFHTCWQKRTLNILQRSVLYFFQVSKEVKMMQFELVQTVISQVCRSFFERDNLLKLMDIRERGPPALDAKSLCMMLFMCLHILNKFNKIQQYSSTSSICN